MEMRKTPESKRKANDKWDKENMTTLGCKVKKQEAAAFKQYANNRGKTSNTLLKEYVTDCINSDGYNETLERDNAGIEPSNADDTIIKEDTPNDSNKPITLTDEEVHACTPYWDSQFGTVEERHKQALEIYQKQSPEWLAEQVKEFKIDWKRKEKQGGLYAYS